MKWRIYSAPEFMKVLSSTTVMEEGHTVVKPWESKMYLFNDWICRQLGKRQKFEPNDKYVFSISSTYENAKDIIEFASFYLRMCCDPFTQKCSWEEIWRRNHKPGTVYKQNKGIMEDFICVTKDGKEGMAFVIDKVEKPIGIDKDDVFNTDITIQVMSYHNHRR